MKQGALEKCIQISEDPYSYLSNLKNESKKKIISCFAMHIPEEIIHAAGMLPVIAWRSNESVTLGHSHVAPYNCGLTRSFVDDIVLGKLEFIDGIVVHRMCLQAQGMPFILDQNAKLPYLEYLSMPALYDSIPIKDFLLEEIKRFQTGIEKYAETQITDEKLNKSIEIYNKNKVFLNEIYEMRRQNPGIIKAREMLCVVHASMIMPKEEHTKLLGEIIAELKKKEIDPAVKNAHKVIISGSMCQTPNLELLDMIEELNMVVVDDDLFIGSRYIANPVEIGDTPLKAIAERYLKRTPPCPTKGDIKFDWTDYLIEMLERNKAKGIINLLIKYCPPHMCYYPDIKNKLAERKISEIMIEVEHEVISMAQAKTRLQSFVEIIGGV